MHHNGTKSVLDLCFCSANFLPNINISTGPCLGSDHLPLLIKLLVSPLLQTIKLRRCLQTQNVKWQEWRKGLPEIEWTDEGDINNCNNIFIQKVLSSEYKINKSSGNYNPKFCKDWWNSECSKLVALRRKAKNMFSKRPNQENLRKLRVAENKAKEKIKESKAESWKMFASGINFSTNTVEVKDGKMD